VHQLNRGMLAGHEFDGDYSIGTDTHGDRPAATVNTLLASTINDDDLVGSNDNDLLVG
jgi:hypothetical protein